MPQLDRHHFAVSRALEKDGWLIVRHNMGLLLDRTYVYIDIEARRSDAFREVPPPAIGVEVKVLAPRRVTEQIERALGQYIIYRSLIEDAYPSHVCYLALSERDYRRHLSGPNYRRVFQTNRIHLLIFDEVREEVVQWIP